MNHTAATREHLLASFVVLILLPQIQAAEPEHRPGAVGWASKSTLHARSKMFGVAKPQEAATLRFLIPGTIAKRHVNEGQNVKRNDLLVSLDDRMALARLRIAETAANRSGDLEHAATQLKFGEKQLVRVEALFARNAVSELELEEQRSIVARARAVHKSQREALALAECQFALAEEQHRSMTLFAPFDGVVTQIHQNVGASIEPSVAIISIANLRTLQVEMHTPVTLFGKIRPGDRLSLAADKPVSSTIEATVLTVSPIINSASETFRAVLEIDNRDKQLPAGFSVVISDFAVGD